MWTWRCGLVRLDQLCTMCCFHRLRLHLLFLPPSIRAALPSFPPPTHATAAKACKVDADKSCNVTWFFGYKAGQVIACLRCGRV